jgi:hypothetical protein
MTKHAAIQQAKRFCLLARNARRGAYQTAGTGPLVGGYTAHWLERAAEWRRIAQDL